MDKIEAIVLAIAGPVNQPVIRFSNNPWHFTRGQGKYNPILALIKPLRY